MDHHNLWETQLSEITCQKIHLELYDNKNAHVKKYVKESSIIIYESPEAYESNDEDFEKNLAVFLKKEW